MTELANACGRLVLDVLGKINDFIFHTNYPGFTSLSIGAVLVGLLLIDLGWHYFNYFLASSGTHFRSQSGADK